MKSFIVRLGAFALALYLTATLVDGIYFDSIAAVIMAAVVLSILNAIYAPSLSYSPSPSTSSPWGYSPLSSTDSC